MKSLKYLFLILILILFMFSLTGCTDASGIETMAYVVALGIDEGKENAIRLTLQIATLNNSESGSSSQSSSSAISTVECATIDSGIALINSYISKEVNLSHCKAIIISESLAEKGLSEHIFTLVSNIQVRPDCNIIISRCDASDFLENFTPTLESVSARYYELILNSSEYTGYTANIYLSDFYSHILSTSSQATAILGGVNTQSTHRTDSSDSLDDDYKADETPIETQNHVENMGLAVFRGDKLVGELTNMETLCHLMVTNELQNATITIPNPYDYSTNISLSIELAKDTESDVKLINGTPYITVKIYLNAYVASLDSSLDLADSDTLEAIKHNMDVYVNDKVSNYLYKTSKSLNSDIANFGRHIVKNYLTWEDWMKADWLSNYENSFFQVEINSSVISGYLFTDI